MAPLDSVLKRVLNPCQSGFVGIPWCRDDYNDLLLSGGEALARTPVLVQFIAFYRIAKRGASLGARLGIFRGSNSRGIMGRTLAAGVDRERGGRG